MTPSGIYHNYHPSAMATTQTMKTSSSSIGAPAQRTQSSRKGKRAWRKNVDLQEVEEGQEALRAEERLTGYVLLVSQA